MVGKLKSHHQLQERFENEEQQRVGDGSRGSSSMYVSPCRKALVQKLEELDEIEEIKRENRRAKERAKEQEREREMARARAAENRERELTRQASLSVEASLGQPDNVNGTAQHARHNT